LQNLDELIAALLIYHLQHTLRLGYWTRRASYRGVCDFYAPVTLIAQMTLYGLVWRQEGGVTLVDIAAPRARIYQLYSSMEFDEWD